MTGKERRQLEAEIERMALERGGTLEVAMIDSIDRIPDSLTLAAQLVRAQDGEHAELHRQAGIRMRQMYDEITRLNALISSLGDKNIELKDEIYRLSTSLLEVNRMILEIESEQAEIDP